MKNNRTIIILIVGALVLTAALGSAAYKTVFAAAPADETLVMAAPMELARARGPQGGYTTEDLAEALGITVEDLDSAYQAARLEALDQAVADGLITQAQADALINTGRAFPFCDRWGGWMSSNGIDFDTFLADALDISEEELEAAYQTATFARIDAAVESGKLSEEQAELMKGQYALFNDSTFRSRMTNAYTDAVNEAAASGVITEAQAEQILTRSENMFLGGRGGRGDWMGGGHQPFNP